MANMKLWTAEDVTRTGNIFILYIIIAIFVQSLWNKSKSTSHMMIAFSTKHLFWNVKIAAVAIEICKWKLVNSSLVDLQVFISPPKILFPPRDFIDHFEKHWFKLLESTYQEINSFKHSKNFRHLFLRSTKLTTFFSTNSFFFGH